MFTVEANKLNKLLKRGALAVLATAAVSFAMPQESAAQFGAPEPPPVGDGSVPAPVIPGDTGAPPPVATGQADSTPGHNFPTGAGRDRSVVYIFHNDARGQRMARTVRPDGLSNDQLSQIEGILGVNMRSGEPVINATASDAQMEQINEALAPAPQSQNQGGRKVINSDTPAASYPKPDRNSIYGYTPDHPLPTVWTFSRYLVILGVVSATIFISLAAWSMVMGNPYGGARVFGAAAGLMMLLCGYTIWKIVQMNTFNANSDTPAVNQNRPIDAQVPDAFMFRPNTPTNPGGGGANGRSGVPVQPLGNANNP